MKTLDLNTWERMQCVTCVPERGTLKDFRMYMRLMDIFEPSKEEKEEIGWTETQLLQDGQPLFNAQTGAPAMGVSVDKPEITFELSLEDADYDNFMALAEKRDTWIIRGSDRKRTETLLGKLEQAKEK